MGVTIVGLAVALPFVIPVDAYRATIERAVHDATGRTLTIAGPLRLTVFPRLGIAAHDVRFSNMSGGRVADMATLGALDISVAVLPLLSGQIEVSGITLEKPIIHLETARDGTPNWIFSHAKADGGRHGFSRKLVLSGIEISDGAVSYRNDRTGKAVAIRDLDLTVDVTRLNAPAAISGHFTYDDARVDFNGRITTLASLSAANAAGLAVSAQSALFGATFKGKFVSNDGLDGVLKADTPSARKLGAWLGIPLPSGNGLGKLSLSASVAYCCSVAKLDNLKLVLDGMTATGDLSVAMGRVRPLVQGKLAVDHLDLAPYIQPPSGKGTGPTHAMQPSQGWSRAPIKLTGLRGIDADLTLSAGAIRLPELSTGKTVLAVDIHDGVLDADLDPMALYDGGGHAKLHIDASGQTPRFSSNLAFAHIDMAAFLRDSIDVGDIQGTGSLTLDVTGTGTNVDAIMHTLAGNGTIALANGRIKGVNLGVVANAAKNALGGKATGTNASTAFTALKDSFTIAQGVITSRDFRLAGPLLTASGKGTINVGSRSINFTIIPRTDIAGAEMAVPVRISGAWGRLHYTPDISGIARGVVQNLTNGKAGDGILGGILGGNRSSGRDASKKSDKGGLLGGILGMP